MGGTRRGVWDKEEWVQVGQGEGGGVHWEGENGQLCLDLTVDKIR